RSSGAPPPDPRPGEAVRRKAPHDATVPGLRRVPAPARCPLRGVSHGRAGGPAGRPASRSSRGRGLLRQVRGPPRRTRLPGGSIVPAQGPVGEVAPFHSSSPVQGAVMRSVQGGVLCLLAAVAMAVGAYFLSSERAGLPGPGGAESSPLLA